MGILDRFKDNGGNSTVTDDDLSSGSAIINIDINRIESNPAQFRKHFNGLEELAESLKEKGVRIPIKVSRRGDNYRIVYGERRWRAARLAGLKLMPCIITSSTDENTDETCLIENLSRDDLNIVDEAMAIREFKTRGYKLDGIAKMIGKSLAYVSNYLKIGTFIKAAQDGGFMDYNEFTGLPLKYRHFLAVAELEDIDVGTRLLREAAEKHLTEQEMTDKTYLSAVAGEAKEAVGSAVVPALTITEYPLPAADEPVRKDSAGVEQIPSLTLPGIEAVEGNRVKEGAEAILPSLKKEGKIKVEAEQTVFTGKAIEKALAALIAASAALSRMSAAEAEFKVKNADKARLGDMAGNTNVKLGELAVALDVIKSKLLVYDS